jgi:predicted site-specific integrase-resolvase
MNNLIRKDDVCELLQITTPTLNKLMLDGKIKYIKLNDSKQGGVRFDIKDVVELITNKKVYNE